MTTAQRVTGNTLGNGEWLRTSHSLWSENNRTEFRMQDDGKIAVYIDGKFRWQNTAEQYNDRTGIRMETNGNLALYNNRNEITWQTGTSGNGSTVIVAVQNDGNVVLYKGSPIWATNTGD